MGMGMGVGWGEECGSGGGGGGRGLDSLGEGSMESMGQYGAVWDSDG